MAKQLNRMKRAIPLSWVLSLADRHGRISGLMRIIGLVSLSWLVSFALVSVSHYVEWSGLAKVVLLSLIVVGLGVAVISSDTLAGALGLQFVIVFGCALGTAQADPHRMQVVAKDLMTLIGGFMSLTTLL